MIKVFDAFADDYSGQGLGYIAPIRADVSEEAGGIYEIEIELPIDESRDDFVIDHENIIAAPAPTRTSPEINFGLDGTIQRQIYKATGTVKMYSLNNRKKALKKYRKNTEFVRLEADGDWYKATTVKGGATGWVKAARMEYVRAAQDAVAGDSASSVVESVTAREQLFRVINIRRNAAELTLTAIAEHITYDLRGVICEAAYSPENIPADEVVAQMMANADRQDHPFRIYCQCTTLVTIECTGRNIIDCLLNAEDGIVKQCGARFIRDNFDIYILDPADRYTGADIRYGDNLTKAVQETDSASRLARIRPVGKDKDGNPLYITENNGYVDSPYADTFAVKRTRQIEYAEAQTGKNGLKNNTQTRAKLAELAAAEFEKGADAVTAKIDAAFVRRELTEEYRELANEAALHIYDIAHVRAGRAGIIASVRMSAYTFSALPGMERYTDTRITDIVDWDPIVYGDNIAPGSISGVQIRNGSINGSQKIKDLTVGYGKFDQAAIDQLNANSVTAVTGAFNSLTVNDELYAAFARVIELSADHISAGSIDTDKLTAAIIEALSVYGQNGKFEFGDVANLVAGAMIVEKARANLMSITNLYVTSANLLNAVIGKLVLQDAEGNYYEIGIGADGSITTMPVELTDDEIANGETSDGRVISGTAINAEIINGKDVFASFAEINTIVSEALKTGSLTATDAFIASATVPTLYTTAIQAIGDTLDLSANQSITLMVGKKSNVFRQDDLPTEANVGDLCIQPTGGKTYQCSAAAAGDVAPPTFSMDGGNLVYTPSADSPELTMYIDDNGELIYDNVTYGLSIDADGNIGVVSELTWEEVEDAVLVGTVNGLTAKSLTREEFNDYYMRIDADNGVDIGRSDSNSRLVLTNEGVGVKIGGQTFSKFTSNYVQFGDYQIRRSAKGALVIKKAREAGEVVSALLMR